jgi:hypothetical protein
MHLTPSGSVASTTFSAVRENPAWNGAASSAKIRHRRSSWHLLDQGNAQRLSLGMTDNISIAAAATPKQLTRPRTKSGMG